MTKHFIILFLLTCFFTSEVAIMIILSSEHVVSLIDSPSEGESEGEYQENSKEESKIEIRLSLLLFYEESLLLNKQCSITSSIRSPEIELPTPPPKQV